MDVESDYVKIKVHQVVRDMQGKLLADEMVYHYFYLTNGKISEFNIAPPILMCFI
jgi:hypothetical protein